MKTFVTEKPADKQEAKLVQHKPISLACSWQASPAQKIAIVNMTNTKDDGDFMRLSAGGSLPAGVIHRIFHGRCAAHAGKS